MINDDSVNAVAQARFSKRFVRPLVSTYCFCNLNGTVAAALGVPWRAGLPASVLGDLAGRYDQAVFFFIDACGWCFLEDARACSAVVREAFARGVVSKLTAQFPSTTVAEVTTAMTGLTVGEHGLYEWFMYEPALDLMIAPLLFSQAGDGCRNTLAALGVEPAAIYPKSSWYTALAECGTASHLYLDREYVDSPYNAVVGHGSVTHGYSDVHQGLELLREQLTAGITPAYHYFYIAEFDVYAHHFGPRAPETLAALRRIFAEIDAWRSSISRSHASKTLVIISADHGSAAVDPGKTIYLDTAFPELHEQLEKTGSGAVRAPAGAARDFFLHVKADCRSAVRANLSAKLRETAEVYALEDLIAGGFFGEPAAVSGRFRERAGDTVILPHAGESVFWLGDGRFRRTLLGNHGGLTPEEMEIPLLVLRV